MPSRIQQKERRVVREQHNMEDSVNGNAFVSSNSYIEHMKNQRNLLVSLS